MSERNSGNPADEKQNEPSAEFTHTFNNISSQNCDTEGTSMSQAAADVKVTVNNVTCSSQSADNINHVDDCIEDADGTTPEDGSRLLLTTEGSDSDTAKDSSTALSPSSLYTTSKIVTSSEECVVNCVVLCSWDNIMGPRIRHLWMADTDCCVTSSSLMQIANHTLNGEICRNTQDATIDIKLYTMTDINLIAMATVFGAMSQMYEQAVHSLTLVTPQHARGCLLDWYPVCCASLDRLIPRLRILLHKCVDDTELAMKKIGAELTDLLDMLNNLEDQSLSHYVPVHETAFWPANKVEEEFLCEAIASHLITSGRTVVLGKTAFRVNMMLNTLSLFMNDRERACSCYVSECYNKTYRPDLWLQGLIKCPGGPISDSLMAVYEAPSPVTLIDLTTLDVKQTSFWPEFAYRRQVVLADQLTALWQDHPAQPTYPTSELFFTYEDKDTIVKMMLEEVAVLEPAAGLREAYVQQFTRMLDSKALALIKYLDIETNRGRTTLSNIKKLQNDQGINNYSDLKIILGTADRLRPGMSNFLLGDPKLTSEKLANHIQLD